MSSDIRLCVYLRKLDHCFIDCTQPSCLVFQVCPCTLAEECYSSYKLIKDVVSISDHLMFQLFSFALGLQHPFHNAFRSDTSIS